MATITKPVTFSAGATIIAADHNSNFDTIYNDYNGNITNANIAAGAAIVDTKLAQISTANKVTFGAVTAIPSCRVNNSAAISIGNDSLTALTFDSERWDTDTMHSTVTNTSRITATTAGKYIIVGHFRFAANATGRRESDILLNGATILFVTTQEAPSGTQQARMVISTIANLAANDYVELRAYQNSGGALNVEVAAQSSPEFMAAWLTV